MRSVIALALAAFSFGAAQAADLPSSKAPPMLPIMARFDWTGFYIGANFGYAWSSTTASAADKAALRAVYGGVPDPSGVFGGVQAGYNVQLQNNIVLGIELAGGIGSGFSERVSIPGVSTLKSEGRWYAMLSGRVGYAFDMVMPYVTGGVALAGNRARAVINGVGTGTFENTHTGFHIGAGIEVALNRNWSVAGEYRYYAFDKQTYGNVRTGSNLSTVTARVNYRF